MENHNWEYVNDNTIDCSNYIESMNNEKYIDDRYYDAEDNEWLNYYNEVSDLIR